MVAFDQSQTPVHTISIPLPRMRRQEIEMTGRRLPPPSPPAPPPPSLEEEDLLKILLRLSPLPSSLPRASAVCTRWRRLISDPDFFRRFRLHHRPNPPLVGFFVADEVRRLLGFRSLMGAPNRFPIKRFNMKGKEGSQMLSCRHGLVLIFLGVEYQFLVWDPVTGVRHFINPPPARTLCARVNGAVLRDPRVDGDFKVVLVSVEGSRAIACVYSSKTRDWGNLVSTMLPPKASMGSPPVMNFSKMHSLLVGDSLYWLLSDRPTSLTEAFSHASCPSSILEFDVERQSLIVERVADLHHTKDHEICVITERGGGLGLLTLSGCNAHFWRRKSEHDDDTSWVLGRTIELDNLLSLNPQKDAGHIFIEGFAEYNHVVVLSTPSSLYTVQFEPLEVKKLHNVGSQYHAFESVCTTGNGGRPNAADVPQNA